MRFLILALLIAGSAGSVSAQYVGPQRPAKSAPVIQPAGEQPRQGGDTIGDALVIPTQPYWDAGTTAGYTNDYDESCPYGSSLSPDVVYAYTPASSQVIGIDLCGSSYDTKLYVYDENLNVIACNDDYYFGEPCGMYVSFLPYVPLTGGMTYYIIVDGYGGAMGEYEFSIAYYDWCLWTCNPEDAPEGEPPLQNDQLNDFNAGCAGFHDNPFQELVADAAGTVALCGHGGWYDYAGNDYRDTDWFTVTVGPGGVVHAEIIARFETYLFHIAPTDCAQMGVVQMASSDCELVTMDVAGTPGEVIWLWTGATQFSSPDGTSPYEYEYELRLSGLMPVVATEAVTWGAVKNLYR